jgi:nitrate/TMAO reductase-like tetraheme cytochrome c subunit
MRFRLTTRLVTVAAIVLTVVVVLLGASLAATSSPRFCSSCKNMQSHVTTYEKSAHREFNCEQCHTQPGPFFFLTSKLADLQEPIQQITGNYEKPIVGLVPNQSCRRCHTNKQLDGVITVNGIRVQHKHLIDAGFLCMRCHSTVAHGDAVPSGARTYPSMDQCLLCHNNHYTDAEGQVATSRCDLCHAEPPKGAEPASHENPQWKTDHGSIGILSTCSACHVKKNACSECHNGIEMPHDDLWVTQHGKTVEAKGEQACEMCHDTKKFCVTCHQVKMPHPSNFLGRHPKVAARVGTDTCFNCHTVANCQACHTEHNNGTPPAHQLFKGVKYSLPATPSPSATATGAGG